METRILVPLDGSRLSEQSLPYAMTLGQRLPAELVLFSAISIPSDVREALEKAGLEPEPLFEELEIGAGEYLEALAHLLSKAELSVSHVVLRSRAAEAIVEYAEQADIQLIVMASHGYTGIARWTHGSVAERVLLGPREGRHHTSPTGGPPLSACPGAAGWLETGRASPAGHHPNRSCPRM